MKFGQSIAMLVFTSLAIIGTEQDLTSNDITANPIGLMIVAIVAVAFCLLGALILFFYNEKKVMKTIAKAEDTVFLAAIEGEDEAIADTAQATTTEEPIIEAQEEDQETPKEEANEKTEE